jgi:hypothetical protein
MDAAVSSTRASDRGVVTPSAAGKWQQTVRLGLGFVFEKTDWAWADFSSFEA